ncbi:radical SAM protein [Desulforhopalus sp. IMCC35007]|uniref:radical SAM protein n=1 Tax=Desulforhopalus sp. IMCC35007 TaxID=2569543 RepID=UPI0010ADB01C|nr:radical SAM protein [Desulforhopalus sp. IMCC35007]TKB11137.1 radical SAM protein [Desulforhopalus sp. IMCC35007]
MHYTGTVIRPPSEADSIILQVTTGCSHNKCSFCGAYKDQTFAIKDPAIVAEDFEFARTYCKRQKRLFLADGDVLILSQARLLGFFKEIKEKLPWVNKVSLYGSAKAIRNKTIEELQVLKSLGLDRVYMGLESGCDEVLQHVKKDSTALQMIEAGQAVKKAGLFLSVTVLLGLGGKELTQAHALETAATLNRMQPNQIAVLTLMILENTPLARKVQEGSFQLLSPMETLKELYSIISNLSGLRCQFHANHASTYLPLSGRLPKDQQLFLTEISKVVSGNLSTVPEHRRAL